MEGMSDKMDKKPAAPMLPMSVEMKQQQPRAARPPFLHIHVQLVNLWTLVNGVVSFAFGVVAYYFLIITRYPSPASWLLPRAGTDTKDTLFSALVIGMLWCSTTQAAAGALALLLPSHRWRLRQAAAHAALTFTVASRYMSAGVVLLFVRNDPEALCIATIGSASIFICVVFDLLGVQALLRGEWEN